MNAEAERAVAKLDAVYGRPVDWGEVSLDEMRAYLKRRAYLLEQVLAATSGSRSHLARDLVVVEAILKALPVAFGPQPVLKPPRRSKSERSKHEHHRKRAR